MDHSKKTSMNGAYSGYGGDSPSQYREGNGFFDILDSPRTEKPETAQPSTRTVTREVIVERKDWVARAIAIIAALIAVVALALTLRAQIATDVSPEQQEQVVAPEVKQDEAQKDETARDEAKKNDVPAQNENTFPAASKPKKQADGEELTTEQPAQEDVQADALGDARNGAQTDTQIDAKNDAQEDAQKSTHEDVQSDAQNGTQADAQSDAQIDAQENAKDVQPTEPDQNNGTEE